MRRWLLAIGITMAAVVGLAGIAAKYESSEPSPETKLEAVAWLDEQCDGVNIRLSNHSSRTLKKVDLHANIYERGNSEPITGTNWLTEWTFIVSPNETRATCWPLQPLKRRKADPEAPLSAYVVRVEISRSTAQFYENRAEVPQ